MSRVGFVRGSLLQFFLIVAMFGCGRQPDKQEAKDSVGKNRPSFKEGKGLFLPEETKQSIGLEIADVTEQKLSQRITAEVQVYEGHSGGVWRASGVVSQEQARLLRAGQPVSLSSTSVKAIEAKLMRIERQAQLTPGQAEIVIEIPANETQQPPGSSLIATMTEKTDEPVTAIPAAALLRAAQGNFVYVVNGERLLRTPVKVGGEGDGFVQIKDGLYAGDKVAVKPVETLWLTELRLASAGGDTD